MAVEHAEVGHNDRYWEGDHKDTTKGAKGADDEASVRLGDHVPIAHRGHGYYRPPKSFRYAFKVVLWVRV